MNQPATAHTPGDFRPETVSHDVAALRAEISAADGPPGYGGVDVESDPDGWTVVVQLPGVAAEELNIDVERRELRVRTLVEEGSGGFAYRLALPAEVDTERVDATMDHGLLTVRLPRADVGDASGATMGEEPQRDLPVGAVGVDELPPAPAADDESPREA